MKRIAFIVVMTLASLAASAAPIRYFTYAQAKRTVNHLNAEREMMIYCGYDYEIETYVLINDVWMERVNSSYYELWVYGYDAYTGDEVYMPLDLECVWLLSGTRMYNAAQYLRFHATVKTPAFAWYVPPYNSFVRVVHSPGYVRSYHYDIHRHGWMPPAPPAGGYGPHHSAPLPPYYMRTPQAERPAPADRWTPGAEKPRVSVAPSRTGSIAAPSRSHPTTGAAPAAPSRNSGAATSPSRSGSNSSSSTTPSASPSRSGNDNGTSTASPSRSNGSSSKTPATTSPSRSGKDNSSSSAASSPSRSDNSSSSASSPSRSGNSSSSSASSPSRSGNSSSSSASSPSRSGNSSSSTKTSTTASPSRSATPTKTEAPASSSRTASPSRSSSPSRK